MTGITYYHTQKRYDGEETAQEYDAVDLIQAQNNICINMTGSSVRGVKKPRLYVCRGKGLLKLNRNTLIAVNIPKSIEPMTRCCSDVEIMIGSEEGTGYDSVFATVERVLRFPRYLDVKAPEKTGQKEDGDAPDEDAPDEGAEEAEEQPPAVEVVPARPIFERWLARRNGGIIAEHVGKGADFVLAHDGRILLLVSFFDEPAAEWLADEERFNGEPPMWFSERSYAPSPVYPVGKAARHLERMGLGSVLPIALMGDHVDFVNAEDMAEDWKKLGVTVCRCTRSEDGIPALGDFVDAADDDRPDCRLPDEPSLEKLKRAVELYEEDDC